MSWISIPSSVDPAVRKALQEVMKRLDTQVATKQDLKDAGLITIDSKGKISSGLPVAQVVPQPPSQLTATGAFNKIMLQWVASPGTLVAGYEVFRAATDDITQAEKIGYTTGVFFTDTPPDSRLSETYYYWVRAVSKVTKGDGTPIYSAYNDPAGTPGSTADEPEYVLETLLKSKWQATTAYSVDDLCYPTKPNGYAYKCTVAGNSAGSEPAWPTTIGQTVVDGGVTWECTAAVPLQPPFVVGLVNGVVQTVIDSLLIGDATITNAKIKDLAGDKITGASITADKLAATLAIVSVLQSQGWAQGSGWQLDGPNNTLTIKSWGDIVSAAGDAPTAHADATGSALQAGTTITAGGVTLNGGSGQFVVKDAGGATRVILGYLP